MSNVIFDLWAQGLSYSQIAKKTRRSRNAVAGIIWRSGRTDWDRDGKHAAARHADIRKSENKRFRDNGHKYPSRGGMLHA